MATKIVGGIAADLIARTEKWTSGFDRARRDAHTFTTALNASLAKVAGFAAVSLGLHKLVGEFNTQRQAIESMGATAARLQMPIKILQGFQLAAAKANLSTEELTTGLTYMVRNIGEAISGNASIEKAFSRIGVSASALAKLSVQDQFGAIADGINHLRTVAEKTSVVMDIFGRSGAGMLELIGDGAKGIAFNTSRIESLGLAIDEKAVGAVKRMNDQLEEAKAIWTGLYNDIVIGSAHVVGFFTDSYNERTKLAKSYWGTGPAAGKTAREDFSAGLTTHSDINNTTGALQTQIETQNTLNAAVNNYGIIARRNAEEGYKEFDDKIAQHEEEYKQIGINSDARKAAHLKTVEQIEQEKQLRMSGLQQTLGFVSSITSGLAAENERWFNINKGVAIAETIINTIAAAQAAIRAFAGIPGAGAAAATAIGIAGAARVAQIRATTFEGGGSIGSASAETPATSGAGLAMQQRSINLVLKGGGRYSREEVVGLMEEMGAAMSDGYRLTVS